MADGLATIFQHFLVDELTLFYYLQHMDIKSVVGYEGYYMVSSDGRLFSIKNRLGVRRMSEAPDIMERRLHKDKTGYIRVLLSKGGAHKREAMHRILAEAFIPNPNNKPQINHKNGIRHDNRLENLEWVDQSENLIHAFRILGKGKKKKLWSATAKKRGRYASTPIIGTDKTGQEFYFKSINAAARVVKGIQANIQSALDNPRRTSYGFVWKRHSVGTTTKNTNSGVNKYD